MDSQIALEAGQPLEFVGVFLRAQGGTIGHIEIEHPHPIHQGTDHPLLLAQAWSLWIVGKQGLEADLHVVEGKQAEQGDAVVRLLPTDDHLIAQGFKGRPGKEFIGHLGFLQAEHLGTLLLQPGHHLIEAGANRIHVPGGDAHGPAVRLSQGPLASVVRTIR